MTEVRRQMTEVRRQMTEVRRQMTEVRRRSTEGRATSKLSIGAVEQGKELDARFSILDARCWMLDERVRGSSHRAEEIWQTDRRHITVAGTARIRCR